MVATFREGGLVAWAEASGQRRTSGRAGGGLRFVFYGRVSTEDWQDPVTSRGRQREQAEALVRGHGHIVAEFFYEGESRSVAWGRRPQTAALVALLADACRVWDAIVVGEYGRAFYGSQYALMAPLFEHYGVQLWMPEAGGSEAPRRRRTRRGADARHHASPEDIIAALRNTDVTLTFDPAAGTLHAEGAAAIQIVTRKEAG